MFVSLLIFMSGVTRYLLNLFQLMVPNQFRSSTGEVITHIVVHLWRCDNTFCYYLISFIHFNNLKFVICVHKVISHEMKVSRRLSFWKSRLQPFPLKFQVLHCLLLLSVGREVVGQGVKEPFELDEILNHKFLLYGFNGTWISGKWYFFDVELCK